MSDKIKITETFYALQGEGRYTGVPSIFLRTFGCNFTCSGFGMPKGELSNERNLIAISGAKKLEDLPLVTTGCDSYAAWDPRFKKFSPMMTVDEIATKITELLPFNEWRDEHLVITGGEPLLGWQRSFPALLEHEKMKNLKELTFETNGTQFLAENFKEYLEEWSCPKTYQGFEKEITFSVSPKLSCSGQTREEAIKPEIVVQYQNVGTTYLKFVVATEEDISEALEVIQLYRAAGFTGHVYLMPVGGVEEVYYLNNRNVAEAAMKHGLRYSDRLHLSLFGNKWGT